MAHLCASHGHNGGEEYGEQTVLNFVKNCLLMMVCSIFWSKHNLIWRTPIDID